MTKYSGFVQKFVPTNKTANIRSNVKKTSIEV